MARPMTLRVAIAIAATILGSAASTAFARSAEQRPKYTFLRYDEDWSFLRDLPKDQQTDFWDPIKYVPLNDDSSIWASFGGRTRFRLENWRNFDFLPSSVGDDTFLLWRALLHIDLHVGDHVRFFVQGKSALSTERDLPGGRRTLDVDTLALQQAFADLRIPLGDTSLTLRGGRQQYLFGHQRLVSPLPWANTLRAWDGVTGIVNAGSWIATGFWSQFVPVRKYDFNTADAERPLYGVYVTNKLDTAYIKGLDLYFLGLENQDPVTFNGTTGTEDRYTLGGRVWGKIGDLPLDYDLEGAYQFGRVGSNDVNAYMFGTEIGYLVSEWPWKPRFSTGFEMGSGDDEPGGDVETFNQLFPLGHAYFGYIDLIGRQNALDLHFDLKVAPLEKLTAKISGHYFWRDSTDDALYNAGGAAIRPGSAGSSSEIGQEIDVTLTYRHDRHTIVELGYSHFFAGEFIEESGPSNDIDFLYLQVRYSF